MSTSHSSESSHSPAARAREVSRADASSICMLTGFGGIAAVSACSAMREGPGISPGAAFAAFASPDLSAAVAASARAEAVRRARASMSE